MPNSAPPTAPTARARRRSWLLLAVSLGTFMTLLDNNVVNVAIPTIQRSLGLSEAGIEWVVSAYILCFAGLLLAGGRLADVIGRRRVFLTGLVGFVAASVLAGSAGSAGVLITARGLQGLFASLLTPAALALVTAAFPDPGEQARAIGLNGAVGGLALAIGPLVGGTLSQHVSWHWIFFLNGPVGALTLLLAIWSVPADTGGPARRLDLPGVASSALALFALTYGLIEGQRDGWTSAPILASLGGAAAATAAFVAVERRVADPMIDLHVFADRAFRAGTAALMAWAFGLFGIYFFTAVYLQDVLGFSPTEAGAAFVPMALVMAAGAAVSDRVVARLGSNRVIGAAMVLMAAGIASVSLLGAHAGFATLMPGFVVIGAGGGLTIPLTTVVVGAQPADTAGVAAAVFNASREVAGLLGVTVIGVVLSARRSALLHTGQGPLQAFLGGYRLGLLVAAALVATGGIIAWTGLPRRTGDQPAPVLELAA